MSPALFEGMYAEARDHFDAQISVLRDAGLDPAPGVELREDPGLWSFCDVETGHVHIGLPSPDRPESALSMLYLQSLYGLESEPLDRFLRLLLPSTTAHELAHHLRARHVGLSQDTWWEEQIAVSLARTMVLRGLAPAPHAELAALLDVVIASLARASGGEAEDFIATYEGTPNPDLARRARACAALHAHTEDPTAYLHLQMGWLSLALRDPRPADLRVWGDTHLGPSSQRALGRAGACAHAHADMSVAQST